MISDNQARVLNAADTLIHLKHVDMNARGRSQDYYSISEHISPCKDIAETILLRETTRLSKTDMTALFEMLLNLHVPNEMAFLGAYIEREAAHRGYTWDRNTKEWINNK